MNHTALDSTYRIDFNIRPVRIAYFLFADDEPGLARTIRLCCTQWGGLGHLIIPVSQPFSIAPLYRHLLEIHEPDRFVAYFPEDNAAFGELKQLLRDLFPNREIEIEHGETFEELDSTAHVLGVIDEEALRQHGLTQPHIAGAENELLSLALYGGIYPGQESDYESAAAFQMQEMVTGSEEFWQHQLRSDPFASVLNLTASGYSVYRTTNTSSSNHFDLVIVNSVSSICLYWNCRLTRESVQFESSLGRRTLLIPESLFQQPAALDRLFTLLRRKLSHTDAIGRSFATITSNLHLRLVVWDEETRSRCEPVLAGVPLLRPFQDEKVAAHHTWQMDAPVPAAEPDHLTYRFTLPMLPESYQEGIRSGAPTITALQIGKNQMVFQTPAAFANRSGGDVVLDVESDVWKRIPPSPAAAGFISTGATFSRYGLSQIVRLGPGTHTIELQIPDEWKSLELYFAQHAIEIQPARVSQYSDALISVIGGLEHVSTLAHPSAYRLLDFLAVKSTAKLAQDLARELKLDESRLTDEVYQLLSELDAIPKLKGVVKTLKGLSSEKSLNLSKTELLDLLHQLVRLNVLKRGFYLDCPRCGTPDWYPLQMADDWLTCSGCSHRFMLPVQTGDSEVQWHYRLNSLVNRVIDQDILPGVLAARYLTQGKPAACLTFGLELHQGNKTLTDLDFVFVRDRELWGGECKKGSELGQKDLDNALVAARLGFRQYFFCTLHDFSEATRTAVEELRQRLEQHDLMMQVTILTGQELLGGTL